MSFFIVIGFSLAFLYYILILRYCYAWIKLKSPALENHESVFVSVIVAVRNEEDNIPKLLEALAAQSYPKNKTEFIFVDDCSSDSTNQLVKHYCSQNNQIKLITLSDRTLQVGKKAAIHEGVQVATGELLITTDADCVMGPHWLSSIVSYYVQTNAKMIVAPVVFQDEKTIFEKMQGLEFLALVFSGGASLYYNEAIMCNGANLAYTKKAYEEVNGFTGIDKKPTGDDVLLMYKIKQRYSKGIYFLKSANAIVCTRPQETLKKFVHQRKRWASKGFFAFNTETKWTAVIVYFFNLFLFLSCIGLVNQYFYLHFFTVGLILFLIKSVIDFLLLFLAVTFFKKKKLLVYFLPQQLIYIFYVSIVGLLGSLGKYEWKGRKLN